MTRLPTELGRGHGTFLRQRQEAKVARALAAATRRYEQAEKMERRAANRLTKTALAVWRATQRHSAAAKAWETRDRTLYAAAEALRLARRAEP